MEGVEVIRVPGASVRDELIRKDVHVPQQSLHSFVSALERGPVHGGVAGGRLESEKNVTGLYLSRGNVFCGGRSPATGARLSR